MTFWVAGVIAAIVVAVCGFGVNIINQKITERDVSLKKPVPATAYILPDPERALESITLEVGKPPAVMLRVKNIGVAQAFDLVARGRMAIGPWPLPADFDFLTERRTGQPTRISPPSEVSYWGFGSPNDPPIMQATFDGLKSGALRFYIYGRIEYRDSLGNDRWTNFAFALVPPADPQVPRGFGLQRLAQHNDADLFGR